MEGSSIPKIYASADGENLAWLWDSSSYPSWHKKENMLRAVGVDVEYGELLDAGVERGNYKTLGDKEHVETVSMYADGLGYNNKAEKIERSTRTPYTHVHKHNNAVNRSGFCAVCRRAGGKYSGKVVKRGIVKTE